MLTRLLLASGLMFGALAIATAQDAPSFAGKWSGPWTNSLGEKGNSNLKLSEDGEGNLEGVWDEVAVKGERINKNTIELRGKNATRSYQITCTVNDGTMNMKYVVTRLNMDGSYDGKATLTRE